MCFLASIWHDLDSLRNNELHILNTVNLAFENISGCVIVFTKLSSVPKRDSAADTVDPSKMSSNRTKGNRHRAGYLICRLESNAFANDMHKSAWACVLSTKIADLRSAETEVTYSSSRFLNTISASWAKSVVVSISSTNVDGDPNVSCHRVLSFKLASTCATSEVFIAAKDCR